MNAMTNLLRTSPLLALICVTFSSVVWAQAPTKRLVHVTITDSMGRVVTSVDQTNVGVVENGARRPITKFTELSDEYVIGFETAKPSGEVKVLLERPRGLPPLRANVKT